MAASFSFTGVRYSAVPKLHLHRRAPLPNPSFPSSSLSFPSRPTVLPIVAPASASSPTNPKHLSALIKPLVATLTAAAALLLTSFSKPTFSIPISHAVESETLPSENTVAADADEERERILEERVDENPDSVKDLTALMELKIKHDKFHDAVSVIERLEILNPNKDDDDSGELDLLKSHLLAHAGELENARMGFEGVLEKDPFHVEAYHGLIMVAGKYTDADEARMEMGNLMERIEMAMEMCQRAKRKDDLRDFNLLVGQIKVTEGKFDEAIEIYNKLAKEEPRDFRPYLCQGIVYAVLKKKGEAEKQFEKYRRLVPEGHPYAKYFDENMLVMKVFDEVDGGGGTPKKETALGR